MDPVLLTRELIRIPSPSGEEAAVVTFVADRLAGAGWRVTRQPVGSVPGRDNVYATLDPPVVVLSTHLDVVPPHLPDGEDAEWVYGRGACDAKGIAAAMIVAAERLRAAGERRVGLLFVVGEEDGSEGARAAAALEPRGRFLVNGEPTGNQLAIGHPGALRVVLTAGGRAAHSAYPEEGRSAVHALLDALDAIRRLALPEDALLGATTLNVGRIEGGVAPNVLAPEARAELLVRTVGPSGRVREAIAAVLPPGVSAAFPLDIAPARSAPLEGWEPVTVRYTSDLPLLAAWGQGYLLGPGSIRLAHTAEERIAKADLHAGVDAYVRLASQLLTTA